MKFLLFLQDADAVINGQATPNSAMSISPATSEVYSILDNGNAKSHRHHVTGNSPKHKSKSSKKNNRNRQQNSSNHVERSDLDLDWRAAATSTTTPEVNVAPPSGKIWNNQKAGNSVVIQNQEKEQPSSRPLSADEDTNWRDHRNKPLTENNSWRTIQSKSKNRKIQGSSMFLGITNF